MPECAETGALADDSKHATAPRILLAEDDEALRMLLAEHLRRHGYAVIEVPDGFALLDYVAAAAKSPTNGSPELIISDVRMPGISGFDVAVSLKLAGCALPVIFITAFGSPDEARFAQDLGARTILNKPFELDDLIRAVSEALGR